MDTINLELTKEELLVTLGCIIRYNASTGVYEEYLENLIIKIQNTALENISKDDVISLLYKYM